ncbi:uncharacterized protein LOC129591349 [Paramacrobiotus metropolitanus]|uniref:uncharacterized protein LOC129591349 n=1 Tax=Paramacrobiotus metropolitanus TaxID=2943436 RepID=UPI002445A756|nr:uncharacterized protein LOC129591349 [Paramacrobiotus metropolitanus]
MGNRESTNNTRRVSFQRDPSGSIAVSEEVADRLRKNSTATSSAKKTNLGASHHHNHGRHHNRQPNPGHAVHHPNVSKENGNITFHMPQNTILNPVHHENDSASAKVFVNLEKRWQERIAELEEKIEQSESKFANELSGTINLVEEMLRPEPLVPALPCARFERELIKCYDDNISRSISCHGKAKEFVKCVDKYRMDYLNRYLDH